MHLPSHSYGIYLGRVFELHKPQIEEEVGGELQVDRVDEGKGEYRNIDVDDGSVSPRVPRNQLLGVVAAKLEVCAVYLVRPNFDNKVNPKTPLKIGVKAMKARLR